MIRLKNETDQINFIGSWLISNDTLFDDMIKFFEESTHLHIQGVTDRGANFSEKKTTDMNINPIDLKKKEYSVINDYFNELFKCYNDYKNQWSFLKNSI